MNRKHLPLIMKTLTKHSAKSPTRKRRIPIAPAVRVHTDRKKESSRNACRKDYGKILPE